MPNQNSSDPNQNQSQGTTPSVPLSPQADLPPLPPEFQGVVETKTEINVPSVSLSPSENGSAAPQGADITNLVNAPKKKFGTKKVIATILGILMLVGGVGAGIALLSQKQLFQQKAVYRDWPPNGTQCEISQWTGNPDSTIGGCIVIFCPEGCSGGCGESDPGAYWNNYSSCSQAVSELGNKCGQVDTINGGGVYCQADPALYRDALIQCGDCANPSPKPPTPPEPTPTPRPTPTGTPVPPGAPYCSFVKVYDTEWNPIISTNEDTSSPILLSGIAYRFTVKGMPTNEITKAKFKFTLSNGTVIPKDNITTKKPNTNEYYVEYTVPENTTSLDVKAWVNDGTNWY